MGSIGCVLMHLSQVVEGGRSQQSFSIAVPSGHITTSLFYFQQFAGPCRRCVQKSSEVRIAALKGAQMNLDEKGKIELVKLPASN